MKFHRTFVFLLVSLITVALAGPVLAQDGGEKQGTSTVILQFEKMDVPQEVMDAFYLSLNEQINQQSTMHVVQGGEVTIEELVLTVGCDSQDPSCLASLSDFVDAERMVFGSIQRSEDIYLFSLKMFDFAEQRVVNKISEQTVEGDVGTVKNVIPAIIENFLHGDVGRVEVKVDGGSEPRVYFDGEKMGPAPTILKNLPLGQHVVSVKTSDGEEKKRTVVLRKDQPSRVAFSFGKDPMAGQGGNKGGNQGGDTRAGGPSIVPGLAVTGVGVAGVVFGLVSNLQVNKLNQEAENALSQSDAGETYVRGGELSSSEGNPDEHVSMTKSAGVRAAIGYSVGAVGLGVGGYLLFRALSSNPEGPAAQTAKSLRVAPNKNGVNVGFSVDF